MSKRTKIKEPSLLGHYAGFVSRFFAVLIDIIIIIGLLLFLNWMVQLIIQFFQLSNVFDAIDAYVQSIPWLNNAIGVLTFLSSVTFVFFAYTVLLWVFTGGLTVGKTIMGVRIVRIDGSRLTFWRAWARYIMFWIALIPLGLGLLWVLINDQRRGWHDLTVGTCVIYDWEAREDAHLLRGIRKRIEYWNKAKSRIRGETSRLSSSDVSTDTNAQIPATTNSVSTSNIGTSQENSQV